VNPRSPALVLRALHGVRPYRIGLLHHDDFAQDGLSDVAEKGVDEAEIAEGGLASGVGGAGRLGGIGETYDALVELSRELEEHLSGGTSGRERTRREWGVRGDVEADVLILLDCLSVSPVFESASRVEWKREREGRRDVGSSFSSSTRSGGQGECQPVN
jgi:hypothetical protein